MPPAEMCIRDRFRCVPRVSQQRIQRPPARRVRRRLQQRLCQRRPRKPELSGRPPHCADDGLWLRLWPQPRGREHHPRRRGHVDAGRCASQPVSYTHLGCEPEGRLTVGLEVEHFITRTDGGPVSFPELQQALRELQRQTDAPIIEDSAYMGYRGTVYTCLLYTSRCV